MSRETRTTEQIKANELDRKVYSLAAALEAAGYQTEANTAYSLRRRIRERMHSKDREETVGQ